MPGPGAVPLGLTKSVNLHQRWTTVKEVADHFRRSSVTVSEAITKVEDLLRKHPAFAKELELLTENLIKGRKRKYRITEA